MFVYIETILKKKKKVWTAPQKIGAKLENWALTCNDMAIKLQWSLEIVMLLSGSISNTHKHIIFLSWKISEWELKEWKDQSFERENEFFSSDLEVFPRGQMKYCLKSYLISWSIKTWSESQTLAKERNSYNSL